MNVLLFGQIGVGKSYLGKRLARDFGFTFYEGDDDITSAMRQAIEARTPFSATMRIEFADILSARIRELSGTHPQFCVAQALFKNIERHHLQAQFPELVLVWVKASPAVIANRLRDRRGHIADLGYAEFANPHFEAPDFPCFSLINDGDEQALRRQLINLAQSANALRRTLLTRDLNERETGAREIA
jgi:gluconate kinase